MPDDDDDTDKVTTAEVLESDPHCDSFRNVQSLNGTEIISDSSGVRV